MFGFTTLFFPFLMSLSLAYASPLAHRDVWDPKITSPNANTVWPAGTLQTITWDTSDKPAQVTNLNGKVVLGFGGGNGSLNLDIGEFLEAPGLPLVCGTVAAAFPMTDHPLAQNFLLTDGMVQITVPDVSPRSDYLIVLMGDSGNESPLFSIVAVSSSSGRAIATSSSVTSTPVPITGGPSVTPSPPIATSGEFPTSTTADSVTTTTLISTSTSTSTSPIITSTAPSNPTSTFASTISSASTAGASALSSDAWSIYHMHSMKGLTAVVAVLIMIFI